MDIFRKVAVNIPLLDIIKQVPKYAKFLKDLCTNKRRIKGSERVNLGRNISAFIQPKPPSEIVTKNVSAITQVLPQKCKYPGTFSIPCTIRDKQFDNCMLDLGAGINVMLASVYNTLCLGPLQHTGLIIQLANRSNARPAGVVEDVLVQVNDLIFPADFYILDMEGETKSSRSPMILGRPFMKTTKTKIDVDDGTMSMEFGDIVAKFNIFDGMKHPLEEHSVFHIELISDLVDETCSELFSLDFPSLSGFDDVYSCGDCTNTNLCVMYAEIDAALQADMFSTSEVVADEAVFVADALDILAAPIALSIEQPPSLELKQLPDNMKYAYLESDEKLPVIISSNLDSDQENKILEVLKKDKKGIGWNLRY